MSVPMPASLLGDEGQAWLLRCRLMAEAFNQRDSGNYFKRTREIEDAYATLSPVDFMEKFQ